MIRWPLPADGGVRLIRTRFHAWLFLFFRLLPGDFEFGQFFCDRFAIGFGIHFPIDERDLALFVHINGVAAGESAGAQDSQRFGGFLFGVTQNWVVQIK
jgi:hypothetical protein